MASRNGQPPDDRLIKAPPPPPHPFAGQPQHEANCTGHWARAVAGHGRWGPVAGHGPANGLDDAETSSRLLLSRTCRVRWIPKLSGPWGRGRGRGPLDSRSCASSCLGYAGFQAFFAWHSACCVIMSLGVHGMCCVTCGRAGHTHSSPTQLVACACCVTLGPAAPVQSCCAAVATPVQSYHN